MCAHDAQVTLAKSTWFGSSGPSVACLLPYQGCPVEGDRGVNAGAWAPRSCRMWDVNILPRCPSLVDGTTLSALKLHVKDCRGKEDLRDLIAQISF